MAKVFLSAGHGGSDPGAVSYGLKEKDINLQALLACRDELERHGVTVVCSRVKDEDDPVTDEVKEANACNAHIAVSFHANAGGGDGFEAYYWTGDANGKRLAQLGEKYVKQLGQNSRGIKSGNHLWFVKATKMTAVLFESFFVDNDTDNNIGDTVAEQEAFGVAYAKAILEYLGVSYQVNTGNTTQPSQPSGGTFLVKVLCDLNIRSGPGVNNKLVGTITDKGTYTIVETRYVGTVPWGRLKSGAGWISIHEKYVKRV